MKTIIAATDFSTPGNNAVDYALELTKVFNCRLILVHAFSVSPPVYLIEEPYVNFEQGPQDDRITEERKIELEKLEALKDKLCSKHDHEFNISCITRMGPPEEVIEQIGMEENADFIVVGIIGEAGLVKQHFIGSTAISVARNEFVPTFIIPENLRFSPIRKISFACEIAETERTDLLFHAQHYGTLFDAELEIVTVESEEDLVEAVKEERDDFVEGQLTQVKHSITHLEGKRIARKLEDYFWDHPTDLILLSPKKHPIFHHLFNSSVTTGLAFNARTPILTIK
jgi:nucleotide-binding universal stress UspA family protein